METFIQCLNPTTVYDNNGHPHVVSCGKCPVCLNSKRSAIVSLINAEYRKAKYTFFVTLTYADRYLPKLRLTSLRCDGFFGNSAPVSVPYIHRPRMVDCQYVGYELDGDFSDTAFTESQRFHHQFCFGYLSPVLERLEHKDYIPVLNVRDLQLFLKRLRKSLSKYLENETDQVFRYYAVGEYGPQHFRPHVFQTRALPGATQSDILQDTLIALLISRDFIQNAANFGDPSLAKVKILEKQVRQTYKRMKSFQTEDLMIMISIHLPALLNVRSLGRISIDYSRNFVIFLSEVAQKLSLFSLAYQKRTKDMATHSMV